MTVENPREKAQTPYQQLTSVFPQGLTLIETDDYRIVVDNEIPSVEEDAFTPLIDVYYSEKGRKLILQTGFFDIKANGESSIPDQLGEVLRFGETAEPDERMEKATAWLLDQSTKNLLVRR